MKKDWKIILFIGLFGLLALTGCNEAGNEAQEADYALVENQRQEAFCVVEAWRARSLEYEAPQLYVSLESEQDVSAIAWHGSYTVFYEDGNIAGATNFDQLPPSELLVQDFSSVTLQLPYEQDMPLDLRVISMDFNYGNPPSSDPHIIFVTRWRVEQIDGAEVVIGDFYNGETVEPMAHETWTPGVPVDMISILDDGFDYIYIVQPEWREGQIRWSSLFAFRVNSGTSHSSGAGNLATAIEPPERTVEEFAAFILNAEQVYRDIVLADLFSGHWDEALDEWILSEYLEEAPNLWPVHGWRVLPSSGFTSISDLNVAVHEYWSENFGVSTNPDNTESFDYAEIDGSLYFFPAMASGVGDSFLGVIWELAQFEVLHQTGKHATLRAQVYITSYGEIYRGSLQWEILDGRIVAREIDWGHFVLWNDVPEAIDAMVSSGRWVDG